ncbi:acetolactate synthase, large subunit, biosynthetic type [Desulfovibrio sp. X2]|uniref:biosynthetic-type acetolactate synthase large subunit n=1 Tax=Desulfovibrio sp. X2 TaxID=941449 RepID=UPI000358EFD7|nr:biosynthetic-type acetolactate synthase large subunit [Desulfovibrio sp. X2]EPR41679.1 acetolactate synthase, large subunit, biosynthetic type [Desulfovibrio sp. X2]
MPSLTGAQIVVRLLERQGVRHVAGIPGGANLPLYDALSESTRIRHVLARHEQGAGFIAQGMARVTGHPGVCLATSGPGATNLLTAVADAKLDSVPLVCLTGQVPGSLLGEDAFQEVDAYGLAIPVTKHCFMARSPEELLEIIPEAFRIAASGRPGPVLVDLPRDVQTASATFEAWPDPGLPAPPPLAAESDLGQAAGLLAAAKRPMLIVGNGVVQSGAGDAARDLMERLDMPAVATLHGLSAMPGTHPLFLGMLGMHASRGANTALEECDLILAVGCRLDDRATGRLDRFCPDAALVHVDIDASEIGKRRAASASIAGDAGAALAALAGLLPRMERPAWRERAAELKREHGLRLPGSDDPRSSYGVLLAAARAAGENALVATDVGRHQMRTAQAWPHFRARGFLTSGGLGTMGFGLPAAIGASLAAPDRPVVCVSGDGSLLMNVQELVTAVEQGARVKILLMDNGGLGLVQQQQDLFMGGRIFGSRFEARADYVALARAFGVPAFDLADVADPEAALAEAFAAPGPCLVRCAVEDDAHVLPMVPPGGANCEMICELASETACVAKGDATADKEAAHV